MGLLNGCFLREGLKRRMALCPHRYLTPPPILTGPPHGVSTRMGSITSVKSEKKVGLSVPKNTLSIVQAG